MPQRCISIMSYQIVDFANGPLENWRHELTLSDENVTKFYYYRRSNNESHVHYPSPHPISPLSYNEFYVHYPSPLTPTILQWISRPLPLSPPHTPHYPKMNLTSITPLPTLPTILKWISHPQPFSPHPSLSYNEYHIHNPSPHTPTILQWILRP